MKYGKESVFLEYERSTGARVQEEINIELFNFPGQDQHSSRASRLLMSSYIRSITHVRTHVRTHKLLQACGRLITRLLTYYKLGRSEASEVGGCRRISPEI